MDGAVYVNISTTAYERPMETGTYAQHGPGESEAAQANANLIHKGGRIINNLDKNVDDAINQ